MVHYANQFIRGGGGGGGGYAPQILVGICRFERENGNMRISGTSLFRFERENAHFRSSRVRAEPAVGGDERVEIKETLKMVVSGMAKSAINVKC